MAKQSRLESEALGYRKETLIINDYQKETGKEYSAEHEDAKSHDDENHPLGKGTGNGGHGYSVPNPNASKTQIKPQLDTTKGGGSYDIYGRPSVGGGRNRLLAINIYNQNESYGPDSVDTSANVLEGQYVVK